MLNSLYLALLTFVVYSAIVCVSCERVAIKINTQRGSNTNTGRPAVSTTSNSATPPPLVLTRPARPLSSAPIEGDDEDEPHWHWRKLSTLCFRTDVSKYQYTLCPFQNITQREFNNRNTMHVALGIWDEWHVNDDGHLMMSFTDGTVCGNNKRRKTKVHLVCAEPSETSERTVVDDILRLETSIHNVTEPRICEYEMTIKFPPALYICNKMNAEDTKWHSIPKSMPICKRQHAFLVDQVMHMQYCIDLLTAQRADNSRNSYNDDVMPTHCVPFLEKGEMIKNVEASDREEKRIAQTHVDNGDDENSEGRRGGEKKKGPERESEKHKVEEKKEKKQDDDKMNEDAQDAKSAPVAKFVSGDGQAHTEQSLPSTSPLSPAQSTGEHSVISHAQTAATKNTATEFDISDSDA